MGKSVQKGITLVEALAALAILSILVGAAIPGLRATIKAKQVEGVASELLTDLRWVKSESEARSTGVRISFSTPGGLSCYVVHTGPVASCTCLNDGSSYCTGSSEALKVRVQAAGAPMVRANVSSMLFDPVRGTVTPTASIDVTASDGTGLRHVINILGRVRTGSL